jgi:hypothetical protein
MRLGLQSPHYENPPGSISIPNFSADNLIKAAICELIIIFHCPASCAHTVQRERAHHTRGLSLSLYGDEHHIEAPSELERERDAHTHQHRRLVVRSARMHN